MTEDHYKRLLAMLVDTIGSLQQRIDALEQQLAAMSTPLVDEG